MTPVGLLEHQSSSPRELTVAGFSKQSSPVVLIWYGDQIPSDELKWDLVDLTINGAAFQDPVYVEMITGKVYQLDKKSWKTRGANTELKGLPVWDSPVMIAERAQVELRKDAKYLRLCNRRAPAGLTGRRAWRPALRKDHRPMNRRVACGPKNVCAGTNSGGGTT